MIKSSFVYIIIIIKKWYKLYKLYGNTFIDKKKFLGYCTSLGQKKKWVFSKNKTLKKVVNQSFQA